MPGVFNDGQLYFIKQQMGIVRNMKIEMYSNDHNPPHFHVKSTCGSIDAVFGLYDGIYIKGTINSNDKKRIEEYYVHCHKKLIDFWVNNVVNKHR